MCLVAFTACSVGGSEDSEPEPEPVEFSISVDPQNSGRVSPGSQTFETGDTVTVSAEPFQGYSFGGWTGTLQSSDNPFTFVIEENTDLTANFDASSSYYQLNMLVTDKADTLDDLGLGLMEGADDGEDSDDLEMPPAPSGGLHAFFDSYTELARDYRSPTTASATWDLQLQPGQGDSLYIEWELQANILNGSLIIRDESSSIEQNMADVNTLAVHVDDVSHLLIEYQLGAGE